VTSQVALGSVTELRVLRERWREVQRGAEALAALRSPLARKMHAEAAALAGTDFYVYVPCVRCGDPFPVSVKIGDPQNTEPSAVLCGPCNAATEAAVEAGR